jgi:hypothetical protein
MSEAPKEEAKVQDSQVFNMSEVEGEEDLRDAWGRSADSEEAVNFEESVYMGYTVADLKTELKSREEAGRTFDKSQIKTKRDLVAALEADDKAQAAEAADEPPE